MAERHKVKNQADADVANIILQKITAGLKMIEQKRKYFTSDLNQQLKKINNDFKQIKEPIEQAKTNLTNRLMAWRQAERERIAEQQRQAEEEARKRDEKRQKIQEAHAEKGHDIYELEPTTVAKPVPLEARDTTKVRKTWDFEVINEKAVPNEYKVVDTARIRKDIFAAERDGDGRPQIEIPGVNIFQKEIPVFA